MKLKINKLFKSSLLLLLCLSMTSLAIAQSTVTGTLTDGDSGEALIGANVLVVGTSSGTITDFDGTYSVSVPAGATQLEFSYTGFQSQTIDIAGQKVIDIAMSSGNLLDEVVVIGYGAVKKSDLTGAVSSIGAKDFNKGIIVSPDQAIQGKLPGVQVINNDGAPGAATTIRIRGVASIGGGNEPLYVVDGVPLAGASALPGAGGNSGVGRIPGVNPLNFINPDDIQSIDILKDASASAIYGSRAANGVILVTTKKGVPGEPTLDFSASLGVANAIKSYEVLDANEYRSALDQYELDGQDLGGDADAFDEITRTGLTQRYSIGFNGGTKKGTYRISASFLDQTGTVIKSGLQKYTAGIRGNFRLTESERLTVNYLFNAAQENYTFAPVSTDAGFTGNLVSQALQWNPTADLRDASENGIRGYTVLSGSTINPLAMSEAYDDTGSVTTLLGYIAPSFKLAENLNFNFRYGVNGGLGSRQASTRTFINIEGIEGIGNAAVGAQQLSTQVYSTTLDYSADITDALSFNAVAGHEYQKYEIRGNVTSASNFNDALFPDFPYSSAIQSAPLASQVSSSFNTPLEELQSFFGRVNFN